jgi:hypothetical protein
LLTFKLLSGGAVTVSTGIPFQLPVSGFQDIWQA